MLAAVSLFTVPAATSGPPGCQQTYTRPMFHTAARSAYRAPSVGTVKRRTLRRIVHCQRHGAGSYTKPGSVRWHLARYKRSHHRRFRWQIAWLRIPTVWQGWAHSTAACESDHGHNPRTNLNGFRGIFQWVMSTWRAAGGIGDPAVAGFFHEAVLAVKLARREGTGHWPRCG